MPQERNRDFSPCVSPEVGSMWCRARGFWPDCSHDESNRLRWAELCRDNIGPSTGRSGARDPVCGDLASSGVGPRSDGLPDVPKVLFAGRDRLADAKSRVLPGHESQRPSGVLTHVVVGLILPRFVTEELTSRVPAAVAPSTPRSSAGDPRLRERPAFRWRDRPREILRQK
jgi:hypothetical protein